MGTLTALKIFGPIALVVAIVAAFAVLKAHDSRETAIARSFDACQASAAPPSGKVGAKPIDQACPADLAHAVTASRQAATCDQALADVDGKSGFAIEQTCSAPVKRVVADRDAQSAMVADRDKELARTRADQNAAIERATARATADATRKANATAAIHSAPLGGDGLRVCDAQCLRSLAGEPPPIAGGDGPRGPDKGADAPGLPRGVGQASAGRPEDAGGRRDPRERRRAELDRPAGSGARLGAGPAGRRLGRLRPPAIAAA